MKEQAKRLWGWLRHHRVWSSIILIALLVGIGVGTSWTVNLVRFGLPPPIGQNCGSIDHFYTVQTARADASLQSLACFWHDYQTCWGATVSQTYAGTDGGHIETLTIETRGNRCVLYGQRETWANTDKHTMTFLCTQLSKAGDALQVSACDGIDPFALVPRDPIYESYGCGVVSVAFAGYETGEADDCFFAAYQHCLADMITYETVMNGSHIERDFYIDDHCGIGYWRGLALDAPGVGPYRAGALAACASLLMSTNGLFFKQCGTDGNVFVPLVPSSTS